MRDLYALQMAVIHVDDFDPAEMQSVAARERAEAFGTG